MAVCILEGPDGSGKSTLAEALVAPMDGPYERSQLRHTSQPTRPLGAYHEYLDEVQRLALDAMIPELLVVYDRLHLGELVYGPMFRGKSDLTVHEARFIECMLDDIGVVRVRLDADDDVLTKRAFIERGEDFVENKERLVAVAERYRALTFPAWNVIDTSSSDMLNDRDYVWRRCREADVQRKVRYTCPS